MAKYNGHKSRAAWNVSLWINNDEGLYNVAKGAIRMMRDRDSAARYLLRELPDKTPDGYRYSVSSIRAALVGM